MEATQGTSGQRQAIGEERAAAVARSGSPAQIAAAPSQMRAAAAAAPPKLPSAMLPPLSSMAPTGLKMAAETAAAALASEEAVEDWLGRCGGADWRGWESPRRPAAACGPSRGAAAVPQPSLPAPDGDDPGGPVASAGG